MVKKLLYTLQVLVCVILIIQLAGCGTILYPERRGQKVGNLDVGVVLLDAIGLLFFIIPGVIAFAVDFSNGTIYLPSTKKDSLNIKGLKQLYFDPKHYTAATIEKMIKEETGYTVKLGQNNMRVSKLKSVDEMMARFTEVLPTIRNKPIALSMR